MIRQWVILALLSLIVAVLSAEFYKEAIAYNPLQGIGIKEKAAGGSKDIPAVAGSGWSKDIVDNNLFSPTRSFVPPRPKMPEAPPPPPPKRPDMALKGIVLDQFGDYVAYIEKDRAKAVPVRKGDKLDDVEVVDVKQQSVELKWNEETITLTLSKIKTIRNRGK